MGSTTQAEALKLEQDIKDYQATLHLDEEMSRPFDKRDAVMIMLSFVPTFFIHQPNAHYECRRCPHWVSCLNTCGRAIAVMHLLAKVPDLHGVNALTGLPVYLVGLIFIQEYKCRPNPVHLEQVYIANTILQKLSHRWTSASRFQQQLMKLTKCVQDQCITPLDVATCSCNQSLLIGSGGNGCRVDSGLVGERMRATNLEDLIQAVKMLGESV